MQILKYKPIFHSNTKPFALGLDIGLDHNVVLGIPTCWYLKTLKFALPPTRTIKYALPPMPTTNASQWNIDGVGSPMRRAGVGHEHFMLFVSISFALGGQCKHDF